MEHLQVLGKVIWIDVPVEIIEARLSAMKVERIVGMGKMSLREILEWRKSFYESSFDFRFKYEKE
jgi:shikimate kinase